MSADLTPFAGQTVRLRFAVVANQFFFNAGVDAVSVTTVRNADLSVTKTASQSAAAVGELFSYTMHVSNGGPDDALGTSVSDPLPPGVAFVSASSTQGSCSGSTTVTCAIGTLHNGQAATVTINVRASQPGTWTNTATVSTTSNDTNAANNHASATTMIIGPSVPPMPPPPAPVAPVLSGLTAVHRCVSSAVLEHAHAGSGDLAFSFTLSEAANVTFAVLHRVGSPAWRKCPPVRGRTPGTYRSVGELGALVPAGQQSISLGSAARARHPATVVRLAAGRHRISLAQLAQKRLPPGTYVVSAKAVNSAGQASGVDYAKFWVIS
jgi:uncharacterized repeat protein (TIGR01451 family)